MSEITLAEAKREIAESLTLNTFCMKRIGLSFEEPKNASSYFAQKVMLVLSVMSICYHVFSEIVFIGLTLSNSPRVEDVVPLFHTFGYGALSIAKVFVLWYKKDVFKQLIHELAGIWPMPPLDEDATLIKAKSLTALRIAHRWYFAVNVLGVWFYNLTPIIVYTYRMWQGLEVSMGYVWVSWYPFDKHKPIAHVAVYIFEIFAGQTCVWIMVGTDLLFSGMASHIGLLLRLLQRRLETLATLEQTEDDDYREILNNIKLHQRLIRYCNDLEVAFSLSNLVNIVLSSVNICCVVFVIVLLEPFLAISNKLFLGSALIQIGMLCWYADDILHAMVGSSASIVISRVFAKHGYRGHCEAMLGNQKICLNIGFLTFSGGHWFYFENADVAAAAYSSGWYRTSARCRRALLFLIQRAQKPIAFTAMGFTDISLVTYSSILTRSYSYFALLYTMYNDK